MRVLHLATTYPLHPGDSNAAFIQSIAEGTAARGHEVEVLVPWHPRLQLERAGSSVKLHAFRYSPTRHWHPWGYAQALRGDRDLRADAYVAAVPAAVSSWWSVRRAIRRRSYDVLHAHWLLPNAPIVAAARGRSAPPMVVSCHGSGVYLAERFGWAAAAARWALRRSAAVTGCSGDLTRRLAAFGAGPEPQRMPYGVDTSAFGPLPAGEREAGRSRLAQQYGMPASALWVLAVGRLVYKKGFDVLIDALAGEPRLHCVIVGDGPLAEELEERARQRNVAARLHLIGAVAHAEAPGLYAAADIVAVPSVHDRHGNVDGLPNTLMEALASGTPVVASNVAGIPDVVRHDDNGLLFAETDAVALAAALTRLADSAATRARIGAAARADAVANLGWDRVAERFEAVYSAACDR